MSATDQWQMVIHAITRLVAGGLPPSNRELRDILLPAIDLLAGVRNLPQEVKWILREIHRYRATALPVEPLVKSRPAQVGEVAEMLRGKSLVFIGGDMRPSAYSAIKETFGLK
jgi:hypothetical protein